MAIHTTLDYNFDLGRYREFIDYGDGSWAIKSTFDVSAYYDYMKDYQSNYVYNRFSEMRHVATIPTWLQEQLLSENYVFHYVPEDQSIQTDMTELRYFLNYDERRHKCRPATKEFI